jgi:hypothetical protein
MAENGLSIRPDLIIDPPKEQVQEAEVQTLVREGRLGALRMVPEVIAVGTEILRDRRLEPKDRIAGGKLILETYSALCRPPAPVLIAVERGEQETIPPEERDFLLRMGVMTPRQVGQAYREVPQPLQRPAFSPVAVEEKEKTEEEGMEYSIPDLPPWESVRK